MHTSSRSILGALFGATALLACSSSGDNPQSGAGGAAPAIAPTEITTKQGVVVGQTEGASTRRFLGIPYAAPPTGANRFRPPQAPVAWSGKRDAGKVGPACPQFKASFGSGAPMFDPTTSEDCLSLNVWAPQRIATPRPVMVWFHGGGFTSGTGGDPTFEGTLLSETGDVVIVTLNYRLAALGFAAHPALSAEDPGHAVSGNYGVLDQRQALRWVKDNIAAFGGDPGDVTIFGESAGGWSICMHLVTPGSAGLYHRAVMESGLCGLLPLPTKAAEELQGQALADALGCKGTDAAILACLRAKTPEEIVNALPLRKEFIFGDGVSWEPNVEGVELPDQAGALLAAKKDAKVPLLIGANEDEGTLFVKALGAHFPDAASLEAAFKVLFSDAIVAQIVSHYHFDTATDFDALAIQIVGDAFVCDARHTARLHEAAGNATFLYHFVHPYAVPIAGLGAFHSAELPFVWGNPYLLSKLKAADLPLSRAMQGYWTRFATAGDPNGGAPAGAVAWPAYAAATDQHLTLDLTIAAGAGLRKATCDWMDSTLP